MWWMRGVWQCGRDSRGSGGEKRRRGVAWRHGHPMRLPWRHRARVMLLRHMMWCRSIKRLRELHRYIAGHDVLGIRLIKISNVCGGRVRIFAYIVVLLH